MQAMTRNVPPHTPQRSMSMWKTRLRRCIQLMGGSRRRPGLTGGLMSAVGANEVAVLEVRGEHAVVSSEMGAGTWHEGGEAGDAKSAGLPICTARGCPEGVRHTDVPHGFDGVEHDMSGAVTEGVLESIHDLPAVIDREAFVRDGWTGDVAAEAFLGEEGVLRAELHAGHEVVGGLAVAPHPHVPGDDPADRAVLAVEHVGGREAGEHLRPQLLRLRGEPPAEVPEADDVVAVVLERRGGAAGSARRTRPAR